jgi:hypothetical protein
VILGLLAASSCALDRTPVPDDHQRQFSSIEAGDGGSSGGGDAGSFGNPGGGGSGGMSSLCTGGGCMAVGADPGALPNGTCDVTGIYGMRVTVDVAWGGRNTPLGYITDNGRGRVVVDMKLTIPQVNSDGTFQATVQPCNTVLPPFFSSVLCEVYQPIFPVQLWDSPTMPNIAAQGRYDCDRPGCAMHLMPTTQLIGVDLMDPNGLWPTATETQSIHCVAGSGASCFIDHDGDQHPGVSIEMITTGANPANNVCKAGYPFRDPPLTSDPSMILGGTAARAQNIFLGTRVRIAGDGMISQGCGKRVGKGAAQGFDSRAIGCATQIGGSTCTSDQQMFMDQNMPVYYVLSEGQLPDAALDLPDKSPSTGTSFALVRLGDATTNVTCENVRNAQY